MNNNLHSLLRRQIKTHLRVNGENDLPKDIDNFLSTINSTYFNYDRETQNLENTLHSKSNELKKTNTDHQISVEDLELKIYQRTQDLEKLNNDLKSEIEERKRIESILTKNLVKTSKISNYEAIISSVTQSVHQSLLILPINYGR